jgi:hypothetical protein
MNELLDLETKLSILASNPCACVVCREAALLAKRVLIDVSPSAAVLLDMPHGTAEFFAAEQTFRADEVARLEAAYDLIGRGRCELAPDPVLDTPPAAVAAPEIPRRDRVLSQASDEAAYRASPPQHHDEEETADPWQLRHTVAAPATPPAVRR